MKQVLIYDSATGVLRLPIIRVDTFKIVAAAALCVGCTTTPPAALSASPPPPSVFTPAQNKTLETAAAIADAIGTAPPAAVVPVVIDDADVIRAWFRFDQALDLIDQLVNLGALRPGSARAEAVAKGVIAVKAALSAASDAQRAGTATSYTAALKHAQAAIRDVQVALMETGR